RSEDIPYLASRLVERITQRLTTGAHDISPTAMKMLTEYVWERNIDELEEILEGAISRTPPHQIDESLLPTRIRYATFKSIPASGSDLPQMVDDYERALIETAQSDQRQSDESRRTARPPRADAEHEAQALRRT